MSKHRDNATAHDVPQVFVAVEHNDQVVAVEADTDLVHLSLTPAAAVVLAAVLVRYGSAVRRGVALPGGVAPPDDYDPRLWHDVGLSTQSASARAFTEARVSRYVAPRPHSATGRRRRDITPLTIVGAPR